MSDGIKKPWNREKIVETKERYALLGHKNNRQTVAVAKLI